jgi:UDP-N-acetylmuramate dehydrogenase
MSTLLIQPQVSLKKLNTFGIDVKTQNYLLVTHPDQLFELSHTPDLLKQPRLILGGGSNLIFQDDFSGVVIHIQNKGICISNEDENYTYVSVAAGEVWHAFVLWAIQHQLGGLENLSLIPGTVGAAPIQNIGAYGVELKDHLFSVEYFDLVLGKLVILSNQECLFGYRDSIFKHALSNRAVVLKVTFALPKQWKICDQYRELKERLLAQNITQPTLEQVSQTVIQIRQEKLPDPLVLGNVGSFFKNPVVSFEKAQILKQEHPLLVSYPVSDTLVKLAAGWLIENCGWKGRKKGQVGVYEKQALVLVNLGGATGKEVIALAQQIQADVYARFGVVLEPEPNYI